MDRPSPDAAQVLEPVARTATGPHGRILFRAGNHAGSVMFCLGHQVLITPPSSDWRPMGAPCLGKLSKLHVRQLQLADIVDDDVAEATRAWIYRFFN